MIPKHIDCILPKVQKPGRYCGGELGSIQKNNQDVKLRFAMCFPDLYEVGMSHLGMKIIYSMLNQRADIWCQRVFAPAPDMEAQMRENNVPLYALESFDSIADFDIIGFTLQYELCYSTMLNMLDLAGLPLRSAQRDSLSPLIIAGGPCVCNPEPIADFVDICLPGEGEGILQQLADLYLEAKAAGVCKKDFLHRAAQLDGVYVPSLYQAQYKADGTLAALTPQSGAPAAVKKYIVKDLDKVFYPQSFVVPFTEIVHDRAMVEVQRGCIRGCRFCQAGFIYRPVREKSPETLNKNARDLCQSTGYDEVSLTSLSTSDYSGLEPLLEGLLQWTDTQRVNISLPSLRIDNFSPKLLEQLRKVRSSGLTFAPEAGTQRMRDVINKNITEENILDTCRTAFAGGATSVKLYFMLGLPTETMDDVAGIAQLAQKVVDSFYQLTDRPKGKGVNVTISVACFIPKPFTPFQFQPQATREELAAKQQHLLRSVTSRKINVKYHDAPVSVYEAVLARGDRRLCNVLETVWKNGGNLESWDEYFSPKRWADAMAAEGLTEEFYAHRLRPYDELLPWDHLDYGVSKQFLINESQLSHQSVTTPNCKQKCTGCGANALLGGACFA